MILECSSQNDLNVFLALNDLVNNTIVNIEKSYQTNETKKASEIFEKDDQECPDNIGTFKTLHVFLNYSIKQNK